MLSKPRGLFINISLVSYPRFWSHLSIGPTFSYLTDEIKHVLEQIAEPYISLSFNLETTIIKW